MLINSTNIYTINFNLWLLFHVLRYPWHVITYWKVERIVCVVTIFYGGRLFSFYDSVLITYKWDKFVFVSCIKIFLCCCVHQNLLITINLYFNPFLFFWHTGPNGVTAIKHRREHAAILWWDVTWFHLSEIMCILFLVFIYLNAELMLRKDLPVDTLVMLISFLFVVSKLWIRFRMYLIALKCTHLTFLIIDDLDIRQQLARWLIQKLCLFPFIKWRSRPRLGVDSFLMNSIFFKILDLERL